MIHDVLYIYSLVNELHCGNKAQIIPTDIYNPPFVSVFEVIQRRKHLAKYYLHQHNFGINVADITRLEDIPAMLDLDKERRQWKQEGVLLGTQRGRLEGKQEGVQEGMQQGKQEERQKTARRLLGLGLLTDQQIAEASDLTIEQIQALKAENRH